MPRFYSLLSATEGREFCFAATIYGHIIYLKVSVPIDEDSPLRPISFSHSTWLLCAADKDEYPPPYRHTTGRGIFLFQDDFRHGGTLPVSLCLVGGRDFLR